MKTQLLVLKEVAFRKNPGFYLPKVTNTPNATPITLLTIGLLVSGHAPETHLPKYPTPKPMIPPITAPKNIFTLPPFQAAGR